jgi:purine-nucleoside/S-methyl-5'-thioadenosine phosphorylase / adenosine deaminase
MSERAGKICSSLFDEGNIRHGFFTRKGGVSNGIYASLNGGVGSSDAKGDIAENRRRIADALYVRTEQLLTPYQIHSPEVVVATQSWTDADKPRADAIVTSNPDLAIGISTADCTPVLFADTNAGVIGAAHAGWRGALDGVLEATVNAMTRLGAKPSHIQAAIGPTISQKSYEVGPEFETRFVDQDPEFAAFFCDGPNERAHFDLPGFVALKLIATGIGGVDNLRRCTYDEKELFFSYRRSTHLGEPDYGRQLSVIALTV